MAMARHHFGITQRNCTARCLREQAVQAIITG
jgi:hypothetical protein